MYTEFSFAGTKSCLMVVFIRLQTYPGELKLFKTNTSSKLGPDAQTDRGAWPGVGL